MVYLFSPPASTFTSSVSLLLEGFTFHLPTKGSLAAHNVPIARQTTGSERRLRSSIRIPESYPQAPPLSFEMLWNGLVCCQAAFLPIVPATKALSSKCGYEAQSHPAAPRLRITSNEKEISRVMEICCGKAIA